jgi:phosphoserine phosphatase
VAPLGPLFDEIVCARLGEVDGRFTGEMVEAPPTGEARAMLMEAWAANFGLSLGATIAYADSTSDLPMLEAAGHPGGRQSGAEARSDRPKARLGDRELVEGEGWADEHARRSRRGAPARGHRRRL